VILLNEPIFDLIGPDLEVVEPDRIEMESAMEGSFVETDDCGIIDFLFSRRSIADRFILKVPLADLDLVVGPLEELFSDGIDAFSFPLYPSAIFSFSNSFSKCSGSSPLMKFSHFSIVDCCVFISFSGLFIYI